MTKLLLMLMMVSVWSGCGGKNGVSSETNIVGTWDSYWESLGEIRWSIQFRSDKTFDDEFDQGGTWSFNGDNLTLTYLRCEVEVGCEDGPVDDVFEVKFEGENRMIWVSNYGDEGILTRR